MSDDAAVIDPPASPAGGDAPAPASPAPAAIPAGEPAGDAPRDPNKVYSQDEVDKIAAKIKKNERYRTKKEVEAYYQGRESLSGARGDAPAPGAPPAAPVVEKAPERANFESYEAFLDAKAEFNGRRAASEAFEKLEKEAKAAADQKAATARVQSFQAKVSEKYPDLHERVTEIGNITMPAGMSDAIQESEYGPDLLNHFADNPKEFERIAALAPSSAIREVGRLEARLEAAAKPATTAAPAAPEPSAAPAPIRVVGGTAVDTTDDLTKLVDKPDEWRKVRDKQAAAKRAGGQAAK